MLPRAPAALSLLVSALAALVSCATPPAGEPAPPTARGETLLEVTSTPAGARIIVDGRATGFRSPTVFPLAPGEHRITLSLAGHRNVEHRVRLERGMTLRVASTLLPTASGSLSLTSLPPGASISIDGEPLDRVTPALIPGLAIGTHTVQLRRPGFADWCQAVVIAEGRTLEIEAPFAPVRRSLGTLTVQSQPPGATVTLDGRPTAKLTPVQFPDLAAGTHRVGLTLQRHRSWGGTVTIREGQTENLLVTLRPQPEQDIGAARIETDPPGAEITLNGVVLRQKTPADLAKLAPGTFTLRLSRPGSLPWVGELAIVSGTTALVDVRLEPAERLGEPIRVGAKTPPSVIAISLAPERDGEIEVTLQASTADRAPAVGVLELDAVAADASWREPRVTLADGRARGILVPKPDATQVSVTVGLGSQREVFVLHRGAAGWEILPMDGR